MTYNNADDRANFASDNIGNRKNRGLNTTDFLKLCCLIAPEKSKPILDKIIEGDIKITNHMKELTMKKLSLQIIEEIERTRSENNKNWMDLIKLAFDHAPEESKLIISRVNDQDDKITQLYKNLSETL